MQNGGKSTGKARGQNLRAGRAAAPGVVRGSRYCTMGVGEVGKWEVS